MLSNNNLKIQKILLILFVFTLTCHGCSHFSPTQTQNDLIDNGDLVAPNVDNTTSAEEIMEAAPLLDEESTAAESLLNCAGSDAEHAANNNKQSMLDEALEMCELSQSYWQKGELESALEALDKAYSLILNVDLDDAKLTQQKEDLRFLISKRILEIYASRNIVVSGNHNEIPLEMNAHVESELQRFLGCEKRFFQESYQRSGKYRPFILEALKRAGLPEELSWLPLIESGYKVKALSTARALGLWQFIPSTGYKFGLKRNQHVDERIDFIKSTEAAVAYLQELHAMFGDWMTVLAAYNCGEGRVLQVIKTQNVNYLDNFWDLYQRLPAETARYVPRFLATLHIVNNPQQYGLDDISLDPPLAFEEIEVNRQVHLKDIAGVAGVDLEELKLLNPELRYNILPPEKYLLKIPTQMKDSVLSSLDSVAISQLPQYQLRETYWHRVRSGETLSGIAKRYQMKLAEIIRINNLKSTSILRVGQKLKVTRHEVWNRPIPSAQAASRSSGTHKVQRGDSLYTIAKRHDTTVERIKSLNNLSSNLLSIGQILKIPMPLSATRSPDNQGSTYSVKRGDTAFTIAQKYNMKLDRFLKINQMTVSSKLYPGQQVFID